MGKAQRFPILVVDDSVDVLRRIEMTLDFEGIGNVLLCEDPLQAMDMVEEHGVAVVVLDLRMDRKSGMEILAELRIKKPEISVIVATAVNDLESAVECMRMGAFDYVPKSAETSRLVASVRHALSIHELQQDYSELKNSMLTGARPRSDAFADIVTEDERMLSILRYVETVAPTDKPVLVTGESGTGKELVAHAVHRCSGRKGELVIVNIAGLDDTMFSDTLFGHRKGAYTGADSDRDGLVERAAGGTLFLDEIGDLSQASQVKLLRLIEDRRYYPLGADLPKSTNAAIIAATHRDLWKACQEDKFRKDLFFRLQTHEIALPPLRERLDDIELLTEHLVERAARKFSRKPPRVPPELYDLLGAYSFPGNIRELESMIHDAVGRSSGATLSLESFRNKIKLSAGSVAKKASAPMHATLFASMTTLPSLRAIQDELIAEALKRAKGNQGVAAGMMGISRTTLNRRLKGLGDDS